MTSERPRNHHIISQEFQKGFTDKSGLFWVYDRKENSFNQQRPASTGKIKDFYTFADEDGTPNTTVENPLLSTVDGWLPVPLKKLQNREPLSKDERLQLAKFIAYQYTRVPDFHETYNDVGTRVVDELAKRFTKMAAHLKKPFDQDSWRSQFSDSNKKTNLKVMIELAETSAPSYSSMRWKVFHVPGESKLITSDNPVVLLIPEGTPKGMPTGMINSDIMVALSSDLCLWLVFGEDTDEEHKDVTEVGVDRINSNTAKLSRRFIIGSSKEQLSQIVRREQLAGPGDPGSLTYSKYQ